MKTSSASFYSAQSRQVKTKAQAPSSIQHRKAIWAKLMNVEESGLSIYTEDVVRAMGECGSLLLHHIRNEGRTLLDRGEWFQSIPLKPFGDFDEELGVLERLAEDVANSWYGGRIATPLDLHVLQLVVRNACILLTVFHGCPTFGRTSAVQEAKRLVPNLPISDVLYDELVAWHLTFRRGERAAKFPAEARRSEYLQMTKSVLQHARGVVC